MTRELECIYCLEPKEKSRAHIMPEGLGKGPELLRGVCKKCNGDIGKIEQPIIKGLAPIRNFLQLTDKKGNRARMEIEVDFGEERQKLRVRSPQDLDTRLFSFMKIIEPSGKKKIGFIGPKEKIEEAKQNYQRKYPNTIWEEITSMEMEKLAFTLDFDLAVFSHTNFLRVAAKIALEWWVWQRNPSHVMSADYDETKNFILHGKEANYPIVSILSNERILKYFRFIPFGIHTLFCSIDPRSSNLVILVGVFSMIYFKVILTRKHPALSKVEKLGTINPQTGRYYEPMIRVNMADGPSISKLEKHDFAKPFDVISRMRGDIIKRINDGFTSIRAQSI